MSYLISVIHTAVDSMSVCQNLPTHNMNLIPSSYFIHYSRKELTTVTCKVKASRNRKMGTGAVNIPYT